MEEDKCSGSQRTLSLAMHAFGEGWPIGHSVLCVYSLVGNRGYSQAINTQGPRSRARSIRFHILVANTVTICWKLVSAPLFGLVDLRYTDDKMFD